MMFTADMAKTRLGVHGGIRPSQTIGGNPIQGAMDTFNIDEIHYVVLDDKRSYDLGEIKLSILEYIWDLEATNQVEKGIEDA